MGVRDILARAFGRQPARDRAAAIAAGSADPTPVPRRPLRHSQLPEIDADCIEIDAAPMPAAAADSIRGWRTDSDGGAAPMPAAAPTPATGVFVRHATPTSRRAPDVGVEGPPPPAQAARLYDWITSSDEPPAEMLADDVQDAYAEMCAELGWLKRPWNPIAKHLAALTGGRKTYSWVADDSGVRHRLRVYRFNTPAAVVVAPPPVALGEHAVEAWGSGFDRGRAAA